MATQVSGQLGTARSGLFGLGSPGFKSAPLPPPPPPPPIGPGLPVAAHTFDFVHTYKSTRTGGAPGSGIWSNPIVIFDGNLLPQFHFCRTFSAGALSQADPNSGIIGQMESLVSFTGLAFLGNGIPAVPIVVNFPGQAGGVSDSQDYWDTSQGAWSFGGALYIALANNGSLTIIKSTDGGATWTILDGASGPSVLFGAELAAVQRVGNKICVFVPTTGFRTNFEIFEFDLTTETWGPAFAPLALPTFGSFAGSPLTKWTNGLIKFPNGDYLIIYNDNAPTPFCRLWTSGGGWGAPLVLPGESYANCIIDPDSSGVEIFTYDNSLGPNGPQDSAVHYSHFAHAGAVLTTDIAIIPPPLGGSADGVGHCSIQNGLLFVPRDALGDFTNAVWVGALPNPTIFFEERLPLPLGEFNAIGAFTIDHGGTGYVVGDTGTVNGGVAGYQATYQVVTVTTNGIGATSFANHGSGYVVGDTGTVNGGAVLARYLVLSVLGAGAVHTLSGSGGSGYSLATNVSTTRGGAQPGVGVGLTLDITALGGGGSIAAVAINGFGSGYAVGDTGTIGTGAATYTILSVWATGTILNYVLTSRGSGYAVVNNVATTRGGAQPGVGTGFQINILSLFNGVTDLFLTDPGGGYSIANNVGTTDGGAQPGVGVGLTIDILSLTGKTPSCAYMMFPTVSTRKLIPQYIGRMNAPGG